MKIAPAGMEINMELRVQGLKKSYGSKEVLKGIDYIFTEGVYGILGVNGAGKSTFIKAILDYVKRDKGLITYNGKDIAKAGRKLREKMGYMPQTQNMYLDYTAQEFLFYIGSLKGLKKKEAIKQIEELLHILGMERYAGRRLKECSGGMKQRILLAQALLGDPEVLLLDEPTAGLDPKERVNVRNYIASLAKNRIILLVTHIISDIESIAKEVVIIDGGRIVSSGTLENLIGMVEGKIGEIPIQENNLAELQKVFPFGSVVRRKGKPMYRIAASVLPKEAEIMMDGLSLEDVYMYLQETLD